MMNPMLFEFWLSGKGRRRWAGARSMRRNPVVIMKDGNGKVGKFFREVASRNAVALIKDPPTENANCVTTV